MKEVYCYCSACRNPIYEDQFDGELLVDNFIYDFQGDLDYIELAHAKCRPEWKESKCQLKKHMNSAR